jgi:sec-independent protein translocase protein TatA
MTWTTLAWGLTTPEIALILVVALLLFGGKKLPELAKAMGRSLNELKRGMQEVTTETPPAAPKADETPAQPYQAKPLADYSAPNQKPPTTETKA